MADRRSQPWVSLRRVLVGAMLAALLAARSACASELPAAMVFRDGLDSEAPSWKVSAEGPHAAQLRSQERTTRLVHSGERAELIRLDSARRGGRVFLEFNIPPALVFDELTAAVWVRSNRPGLQFGVRLVFPRQVNPRTGQPLTADLWGDKYEARQQWQKLSCRTQDANVRQLLVRLRGQLASSLETADLDTHGAYIDRVVLSQDIEAGAVEYAIDALEVAPVIDPVANGSEVIQASVEETVIAPVTMGDGRLMRDGRPLFPVYTPYHGEPLEALRRAGFNVVWIPQYDDQSLLSALSDAGLGAMAEPPALEVQPAGAEADAPYNVGLPSFTRESSNILIWHLGSQVPPAGMSSVRAAAAAVRDADSLRRPILVDVTGSVREFHRRVDLVSFSKHAVQTSSTPLDYLAFLQEEMQQALRGKPSFTWVFIEPNRANLENRSGAAIAPQLEPEQIWMQVYAALGAGVKGIGYWKSEALADDSLAARERLHAVTLANLHIHLLRDWLATGKVVDMAPVRLGTATPPGRPGFAQALLTKYNSLAGAAGPSDPLAARVRAPVIKCEQGYLILPQWLEPDGQFQPGPMKAQDVHIILRGIRAMHAWEVTTTGVYPHELKVEDASGGTEITLKQLDQFTAIVVPIDPAVIDDLQRDVAVIREPAAQSWIALAQAKLDRVQTTHDLLQERAPKGVPDGDVLLAEARRQTRSAQEQLSAGRYDAAREAAAAVLRLTRQVQRAHWENAARVFASPVATPFTICFQTLPDFWELMQRVGRSRPGEQNVLRGGDFESWDTIFASGWQHDAGPSAGEVERQIELSGDGVEGRCLHLAARPVNPEQGLLPLDRSPVQFVTHPMPVFSGQIVHVRGHVRLDADVQGSSDGFMVYDNLCGTVGALRWSDDTGEQWKPFELLRPVQHSGELQITIELTGYGDARIDELQVTILEPEQIPDP